MNSTAQNNLSPHAAALELAKRQARNTMKGFISYTKGDYKWGWFNELLCMAMEEFYENYKKGLNPRLQVFAPPRAGKSEIVSRRFPAWLLGQDPNLNIIATSYAASLANSMSKDSKRIILSKQYKELFPDTRVATKRDSIEFGAENRTEYWEMVDEQNRVLGSYRAAGVTKGISGQGFDFGLIDDPVSGFAQAISESYQKTIVEWYEGDFYTRRNPENNGILIIMTRWHKKDLAGYAIDAMRDDPNADQWKIVRFPMEAEKKEYFTVNSRKYKTREKGEILFPARMDQAFVESCKKKPTTWPALYQQRPTAMGGNFFRSDYWNFYTSLPIFVRKIITADTAQKTKEIHDYSVFQCWGQTNEGHMYLIGQVRGKWEAPQLLVQARKFWAMYGGRNSGQYIKANMMYIEDKASGTGLIQYLKQGDVKNDVAAIPCFPVQRQIDKATRAIDILPSFESGLVWLPQNAPWINDYCMEFEDFTLDDSHEHDDQIDPTMDAIEILSRGKSGLTYKGW